MDCDAQLAASKLDGGNVRGNNQGNVWFPRRIINEFVRQQTPSKTTSLAEVINA